MEKIVSSGELDCTVELDGTECAVVFSSNYKCFTVQNETADDIYISVSPNISAGKDGVRRIGTGASGAIAHGAKSTLYILGFGSVQVTASDSPGNFFKPAPAAGGGEAVDAYSKTESDAKYAQKTDVIPYKMGMDFGTCATSEATITKTVSTLNKVAPAVGAVFAIKFVNAVPAQARLTVNGLSGYIQYRGGALKSGVINAGDIVAFMYYTSGGFNKFEIISIENGGNANSADTLTDWGTRTVTDANDAPFGFCAALNCENAPNTFWSTILTTGSSGATKYKTQIAFPWAFGADENRIRYRCENNGEWGGWQEISTTPIKSTTFSGTTDANGNLMLWAASENKIPICAVLTGYCSSIFHYAPDGNYYLGVSDIATQAYSPNVSVGGNVYYIEQG